MGRARDRPLPLPGCLGLPRKRMNSFCNEATGGLVTEWLSSLEFADLKRAGLRLSHACLPVVRAMAQVEG